MTTGDTVTIDRFDLRRAAGDIAYVAGWLVGSGEQELALKLDAALNVLDGALMDDADTDPDGSRLYQAAEAIVTNLCCGFTTYTETINDIMGLVRGD